MIRIGNPSRDAVTAGDDLHNQRMTLGSLNLLNAIKAARGGAVKPAKSLSGKMLLWEDGSFGGRFIGCPLSASAERQRSAVLRHLDEKERVRSLAVSRDPCGRCGTRGDIGCEHRRVA